MASTISYAKIVRNQKDEQIEPSDEKCPEGQKTKCQDSLNLNQFNSFSYFAILAFTKEKNTNKILMTVK